MPCTASSMAVGSDTIVANYYGDANFATSSGSTSQTVNQDTTSTALTSSLNPSTYGQAGEQTTSFVNTLLNALPGHALDHAEAASSLLDAAAQVACLAARFTALMTGTPTSSTAATTSIASRGTALS